MTLRFSGHFSAFDLVFVMLKSPLGIARQWSREKCAIFSVKPQSHVRILIYRTWAVVRFPGPQPRGYKITVDSCSIHIPPHIRVLNLLSSVYAHCDWHSSYLILFFYMASFPNLFLFLHFLTDKSNYYPMIKESPKGGKSCYFTIEVNAPVCK